MNKPRLFCFTYAGGTSSFFDEIEQDLPELELVKPEYAGHGKRHREQFYRKFEELADDVFDSISPNLNETEYGLFGYSMGTITLVEVLKRIYRTPDIRKPSCVFLAAHEPHSKEELAGFSEDELDEWVKERTIRFGGVPEKLLDNKSFWRMYLPIFRSDYSLIEKYRFEDLDLVCDIPTTVFYSETDTPRADMELWRRIFVGECNFFQYEGTHFFIKEHHCEMAKIISKAFEERLLKYDI